MTIKSRDFSTNEKKKLKPFVGMAIVICLQIKLKIRNGILRPEIVKMIIRVIYCMALFDLFKFKHVNHRRMRV